MTLAEIPIAELETAARAANPYSQSVKMPFAEQVFLNDRQAAVAAVRHVTGCSIKQAKRFLHALHGMVVRAHKNGYMEGDIYYPVYHLLPHEMLAWHQILDLLMPDDTYTELNSPRDAVITYVLRDSCFACSGVVWDVVHTKHLSEGFVYCAVAIELRQMN